MSLLLVQQNMGTAANSKMWFAVNSLSNSPTLAFCPTGTCQALLLTGRARLLTQLFDVLSCQAVGISISEPLWQIKNQIQWEKITLSQISGFLCAVPVGGRTMNGAVLASGAPGPAAFLGVAPRLSLSSPPGNSWEFIVCTRPAPRHRKCDCVLSSIPRCKFDCPTAISSRLPTI